MKHTIFLLVATIFLASCAQQRYCQPSKRSKDYAKQWIKEERDGYFTVTTYHGFKSFTVYRYECKPDSVELNRLKSEKPI